jgi:Integrase core domain
VTATTNALAEVFNSLFKAEMVRNKGPWKNIDDLEIAVAEYIDWFNHRRLHGEIGLVPPVEFEEHLYRHRVNARCPGSISNLHRASRHDARTNDARSGNPTSCQMAKATSTLVSVAAVHETLQITVCVLISIAAVVPLFFVWRDDHKWMDRSGV